MTLCYLNFHLLFFWYHVITIDFFQQKLLDTADKLDATNTGIYTTVNTDQQQLYNNILSLKDATESVPVSTAT